MKKDESHKTINITKAVLPSLEDYVKEIGEVWETHWMTSKGHKHQQLESELKTFLGVENTSLFANGHLALESILEAYALKGEVITTPFTFPSTTHAIIRQGCTPVFCDIKESDYNLDETKLESLITEKTVAILPVHIFGFPCNVKAIEEIAKRHDLTVIYDAAHAFGVKVDEIGIGNFGDASMFSMNATKIFNTIEGGLITYKDKELTRKLELIKYYGMEGPESVIYPGSNLKMNEFQAAMGLCNLPLVEGEIQSRKQLCEQYNGLLKNIPGIVLPEYHSNIEYNYIYFPVRFTDPKLTRDQVFDALKEEGINARKYFYPLVQDYECYKKDFSSESTPIARAIADTILCLPLYGEMPEKSIERIQEIIESQ